MFISSALLATTALLSNLVPRVSANCTSFTPSTPYYIKSALMQEQHIGEVLLRLNTPDTFCNAAAAASTASTDSSCPAGHCFFAAPEAAVAYGGYAFVHGAQVPPTDTNVLALASRAHGSAVELRAVGQALTPFAVCLAPGAAGWFAVNQTWQCIDGVFGGCTGATTPNGNATVCGVNSRVVDGNETAVVESVFVYANGTPAAAQVPLPSETSGAAAAAAGLRGVQGLGLVWIPASVAFLTAVFVIAA